jgi:prolyl-tRNA editing enzyme YbaK/EbsC (Cys-tRNA(Pro) deacylase)
MTEDTATSFSSSSSLEARITALERQRFQCPKDINVDDSIRRARTHVELLALWSANWKWVPPNYYDCSLEQRAAILKAPSSTQRLCKSLLLENKKVENEEQGGDPTNPKFMLVIIQYGATLDVKQLATSIRKLRPVGSSERLDESQFDLRVASVEDNDRITGYSHNSVTPFGLLQQQVPIYLSSAVAAIVDGTFWMGGGHVHLKLGMSVADFLKVPNVQVMELSVPRTTDDDGS